MKSRFVVATLTALLAFQSTACSRIETPVSDRDRAKDLLNEQRYEDAAALLERLRANEPKDAELTLLLASAYAGSVGFNVIDSYSAFEPLLTGKDTGKDGALSLIELGKPDDRDHGDDTDAEAPTDVPTKPEANAEAALDRLQKEAIRFLSGFTTTLKLIARIPHTPAADRSRIVQALLILNDVPSTDPLAPRVRLYSSLLDLLQGTNYLRDALKTPAEATDFVSVFCSTDFITFFENIGTASDYLLASAQNLNKSYVLRKLKRPKMLSAVADKAKAVRATYEANKEQISHADLSLAVARKQYCE